jgi:hypothetical protein
MATRKYYRVRGKKLSKKKIKLLIQILLVLIYTIFLLGIPGFQMTINVPAVTPVVASGPVEVEEEGSEIIVTPQASAKEMTVEEQIRYIAAEKNFKWADYLVRLASCESSLNPKATNKNRNGSIDYGTFQFNDKMPPVPITKECSLDVRCSTEKTIEAINLGLQHHWVCDKKI